MKNLLYVVLTLMLFSCGNNPQNELEKKIIGEWCNPYTYQYYGELKGFSFKKGGVCEAINVPGLKLKTWEIKDGYLIIKGTDINEEGKEEPYETKEKIALLNADTLRVIVNEKPPVLSFLYLNTKIIKQRVTPDSVLMKREPAEAQK